MSGKKHHPEDSQRNHASGERPHRPSHPGEKPNHAAHPDHARSADDSPADQTASVDPITSLTAERDDLLNRLQRLSADFCNYQKRAARDIEQARNFANEDLIKSLVPVLDDMDRAIEAGRAAKRDENDPLVAGMKLVHDKAMEILGRCGLTIVDQVGPFNPEFHQALMQEPCADKPPMTVLKVLQKGYLLKGRTIRPASVIVSKATESQQEDGKAAENPSPDK